MHCRSTIHFCRSANERSDVTGISPPLQPCVPETWKYPLTDKGVSLLALFCVSCWATLYLPVFIRFIRPWRLLRRRTVEEGGRNGPHLHCLRAPTPLRRAMRTRQHGPRLSLLPRRALFPVCRPPQLIGGAARGGIVLAIRARASKSRAWPCLLRRMNQPSTTENTRAIHCVFQ